jgi:glutamate N-acetyltransferase/amino-acid N-acetyltransferase
MNKSEFRIQNSESSLGPGPKGFRAAGVAAGIKATGGLDLGALMCDGPTVAAGVTTRNLFASAPVLVCRERLAKRGPIRGVIVNSGCSNACMGAAGLRDAHEMTRLAERAAGTQQGEFLVASTGVIGRPLPMEKIRAATPRLMESLRPDGWEDFARSIMTTDLVPKISRRSFQVDGADFVVMGVAKGSGMIHPNMGTMLAFVATDFPIFYRHAASALLRSVVHRTFNCTTVDGDTSTSDTVILLAKGGARKGFGGGSEGGKIFKAALLEVATDLSKAIARDGEGATKLVTVEVEGATAEIKARIVAHSIARSNLVKTALFGNDPNWGRICCAAGYAGVAFDTNEFSLKLQGKEVMRHGMPTGFDARTLSAALKSPEVLLQAKIGSGKGAACVWTCDLTYDYVKINAEYTT